MNPRRPRKRALRVRVLVVAAVAIVAAQGCHVSPSSANGQTCSEDTSCQSGHCVNYTCNAYLADGMPCTNQTDCKSLQCSTTTTHAACAGSPCKCSQAQCNDVPSGDCNADWVCHYTPPSQGVFSDSSGGNQCIPPCGSVDGGIFTTCLARSSDGGK